MNYDGIPVLAVRFNFPNYKSRKEIGLVETLEGIGYDPSQNKELQNAKSLDGCGDSPHRGAGVVGARFRSERQAF